MNKQEFLLQLRECLSGLPREDMEERLTFYSEMIDDRVEDGISEEDAILQIGTVEEIAAQIAADIPLTKFVKEKIKSNKRLKAWEIVLLVLGSPIWLSLLLAVFAVVLAVYVVLWSVIISLWAVEIALAACVPACIAAGILFACNGYGLTGTAVIAAGFVIAGISILFFYGCKATTKGILILTKSIAKWIKNCFIKKERSS